MTLFDTYSYKQKNFALMILAVLLAAASYKRSFKTTLDTLQLKKELELKKEEALLSNTYVRQLHQESSILNRMLGKENVPIEKVQQGFLNFFARKANKQSVQQIDEVYTYNHPDFSINTYRIDLKGDFVNAVKFIREMEFKFDDARLIHVNYTLKKDLQSGNQDVYTTLLLQNYVRNHSPIKH
jgi:flagellar biosynthesis component FlhA